MLINFRTRIRPNLFHSLPNSIRNPIPKKSNLFQTLTLEMSTKSTTKRPMCQKCSKPARVCLCNRLKTPTLDNSISVTILQHSLEKKHPLNSARIATLGLKNVEVISVSDVNSQALFVIRVLDPISEMGLIDLDHKSSPLCRRDKGCIEGSVLGNEYAETCELEACCDYPKRKRDVCADFYGNLFEKCDLDGANIFDSFGNDGIFTERMDLTMNDDSKLESRLGGLKNKFELNMAQCSEVTGYDPLSCSLERAASVNNGEEVSGSNKIIGQCSDQNQEVTEGCSECAIALGIEKYGEIRYFYHCWTGLDQLPKIMDFDHLLASEVAVADLGKGFVVKKMQRKLLSSNFEYEECEEFGITVPPGSVLLFPSENAVGVGAIDFEVKNLIVLDGTWAKARRMYSENPWLRILPHVKLNLDNLSLYSEVRHQPRAECLSTIESIVYALKALGENSEALDGLLEVFGSMVGDQRRCKNERLRDTSV